MASANNVILLGNLGADPELRYTASGQAVCNLRLATDRVFKDRNGERQEETTWHKVVVWGKQAETCNQYLSKGRKLYVEGRLNSSEYVDKDQIKRKSVQVVAMRTLFLGGGVGGGSPRQFPTQEDASAASTVAAEGRTGTDDLPF